MEFLSRRFRPIPAADLIKATGFPAMASVATRRFSVTRILADAARLLALVLAVPVVILAIGTPIALVIAGLLWLARLARAAL